MWTIWRRPRVSSWKIMRAGSRLGNLLNVGTGEDLSIAELAEMVARIVGYRRANSF